MRIETPRLALRPWTDDDLEPLTEIHTDPEVMRYVGDGRPREREATRASIERWSRGLDEHGFGLLAAELRETGELAGMAGLAVPEFLPEILPAVEVGYRLKRSLWRRGLATEAAHALVAHAFGTLGLERLVAIAHVENAGSRRVLEKLGMRVERETTVPGSGTPVLVFELSAPGGLPGSPGSGSASPPS